VKALDLCSGAAGAWALGLHRAGITTIAACEAIAWRRDLYALNNPKVKLYDDLRSLTGDRLRADGVTSVDLVAGSPPCGEYSSVGSGGGLDADDLFLHAVRIVGEVRPRFAAFENSAFLKTRGYDRIADALDAIGYTSWPFVVRAQDAGARHERPRAFIIAADLSRPQGRPSRLTRPDRHVGGAPDWSAGRFARYDLPSLGPAGTQRLGRHLREFHGIPAGVAEQAREAYGDSLLPQLTEAVGRAIIAVEFAGVLA
jgi:DNA (cytosine-5)-methyltransferase 1